MNKTTKIITTEKEGQVLWRLTGPMLLGILGMVIFNLMDTFYVGQLGTIELAALSFTFPVVLIISSIAHGLGVGMTATVSRASGEGDRVKQIGLITCGLILSFVIVVAFVLIGQITIEPLFILLGADDKTLPVIKDYMSIWYWGVIFVVIPMTGNAAIRGVGDTKTPAIVMLIAAVINAILDPLLIFGIGPFPELGVKGAAIATVCSRGITFLVAFYVLIYRDKLVSLKKRSLQSVTGYLKEILHIGIPNALTKMIIPISVGIITSLIAKHGREAVAGFGVASRIEMFAIMPINALISVLPVFIGQNLGAGEDYRVIKGMKISRNFVLIYGIVSYILLIFLGRPAGLMFNNNPLVVNIVIQYLRIVPITYGMLGIMQIGITSLNILKKPIHAAGFTLLQVFGLYIPLAILGSNLFGIKGIFVSLTVSYLIMGPVSYKFALKNMINMIKK